MHVCVCMCVYVRAMVFVHARTLFDRSERGHDVTEHLLRHPYDIHAARHPCGTLKKGPKTSYHITNAFLEE